MYRDTSQILKSNVSMYRDTSQRLKSNVFMYRDTSQRLKSNVSMYRDTSQRLKSNVSIYRDTSQRLKSNVSMYRDTSQRLKSTVSMYRDTSQRLKSNVSMYRDTSQRLKSNVSMYRDTSQRLKSNVSMYRDTSQRLKSNVSMYRDTSQSTSDCRTYHFNMPAVADHLKRQTDQNKVASYFNIDILKYQVGESCLVIKESLVVVIFCKSLHFGCLNTWKDLIPQKCLLVLTLWRWCHLQYTCHWIHSCTCCALVIYQLVICFSFIVWPILSTLLCVCLLEDVPQAVALFFLLSVLGEVRGHYKKPVVEMCSQWYWSIKPHRCCIS